VTPIPAACGVAACTKNTEGAAAPHGGISLQNINYQFIHYKTNLYPAFPNRHRGLINFS